MHDLKQRLEALGEEGVVRGAASVMTAARRSLDDAPPLGAPQVPPRRSRRPIAIGFVVAVVAVVALVVSVVTFLDGSPDRTTRLVPVVPGENDLRDLFVSSDPAPDQESPLFLVPDFVPAGMEPFMVTGGNRPGFAEGVSTTSTTEQQLWVKLDAAGERPVEILFIQSDPGLNDDALAMYRSGSVPLEVRGHEGLYNATRGSLTWEEPPGHVVGIHGDSLSRADLVGIATGLRRRIGGWTATQAPPGFIQVSATGADRSEGTNKRDVMYRDDRGRAFRVQVFDNTTSPPGHNLASGMFGRGADPRIVVVRGHHAVLAKNLSQGSFDQQSMFLQDADRSLEWLEPGKVRVTVTAVGLSDAEVLAIARGLRPVGPREWEELVVQAPGLDGAVPAPASASPPEFEGEQAAVADAFRALLGATTDDQTAAAIEDGDSLRGTFAALETRSPGTGPFGGTVDAVRLVGSDRALVTFSLGMGGPVPSFGNQQGAAVRVNGRWLVNRATYCAIVSIVGVNCR